MNGNASSRRARSVRRAAALLSALLLLPAALVLAAPRPAPQAPLDFDRDVRPILSENCFACHGFDEKKRQAGLRLDVPESATSVLPSGRRAIVPGDPRRSELYRRITLDNALRMPPAATGKRLTRAQIEILRRWIEQGARYAPHWAFVPPKRPPLPVTRDRKWPIQPIDRFILARLEQEGLRPSPVADRRTLIRRLSLDLTGLPPTPEQVDAFLNDRQPGAYERLVDRLLASPHYGERMALNWLDVARYADTHGYHIDSAREMWIWRDWVIQAFNRNMPYDQFVIEQLAGDLLPNATLEQKIASGFNRNHPINFEGGAIPEEYQTAYVLDRVDTTATAFMALTMRCGQCHDHKYDPITQKEFYRFYAFFNNIDEKGLDGQKGNAVPFLKVPTPEQQKRLDELAGRIAALEKALEARAGAAAAARQEWEQRPDALDALPGLADGLVAHYPLDESEGDRAPERSGRGSAGQLHGNPKWTAGRVGGALALDGATHVELPVGPEFDRDSRFSFGAWIRPAGKEAMTVLSRMDDGAAFRGWDLYLADGRVYVHLIHRWDENAIRVVTRRAVEPNRWTHVFATYDGSGKAAGVRIYLDGQLAETEATHDRLSGTIRAEAPLLLGRRNPAAPFRGELDDVRIYDRVLSPEEVARLVGREAIRPVLAIPAEKRTEAQRAELSRFYLENVDEEYRRVRAELDATRRERETLDASVPTVMVMRELEKPRDTHILIRGQYDKKGEKVEPGVPACLPPFPAGAPPNRLGLARWLVDPAHPLTARVAVNRIWQLFFGTGLVRTAENFGTLGERPSHPELLDWLATEFVRTGWDVKKLVRMIVTSATYRQSSRVTPELLARDPENRLLARGARFRLPGELIRDQALAVSGLLVPKIGGPPVRPYQPPGLWEELAFGGNFSAQKYEQDHGEALYRRSLYTFWKRTCPPPTLSTFDAPEREFCVVRRSITNTPLQALALMNDPTFVEAARKFAERILLEGGSLPADRVRYAYRLALARPPKEAEARVLLDIVRERLAAFRADRAAAEKLLGVGESPRNPTLDPAELAAWSCAASVLLNLDETITRN